MVKIFRIFVQKSLNCYFNRFHYLRFDYSIRKVSSLIKGKGPTRIRPAAYDKKAEEKFDPFSLLLLSIPLTAFGLGTWQVQRKKWKEDLIENIKQNIKKEAVDFPKDISELQNMEYQQVRIKGHFIHERELYLGPRSLILDGEPDNKKNMLLPSSETGYLVITPFKLSDQNVTILVNRGWVPSQSRSPKTRPRGQIEGEIDLIGVVRHNENRPPLGMHNRPDHGIWMYRDLNKMAEYCGTAPILIDAVSSTTVPGGPIGGQTRVTLRNEHLSYILTWYGLCAATGYMWYKRFKGNYFTIKNY